MTSTQKTDDLRQIIREVIAELGEQRTSLVELARTASGATTIAVKQYAPTVYEAYQQARATFDDAELEYPNAKK